MILRAAFLIFQNEFRLLAKDRVGLFMLLAKDQHQTDVRCAIADFREALKIDPKFQQPADGLQRLQGGSVKSN